jgi:HAD superfamily hydrolase (TIGR01509 family)
MRLANITCYLFDLDGTLVDSSPVHERAYRHVLGREHPHLLAEFDYRAISGLTTLAAFQGMGLNESDSRRCTLLKQSHYREALDIGAVREMTGAKDLLRMLTARGAIIGVVTSASRASALKVLDLTGLAPHVTDLVAAEDVTQTKPAPEPFLSGMTRLKADAAQTIAVEDAPSGIASARVAGLKVIGMHDDSVRPISDLYFPDFAHFAGALA